MGRYYILRDRAVVEEPDFGKWLEWHQTSYEKVRCIAHTGVKFGAVVTVFLGMNMRESEADPPWLFDTRVCGGWLTGEWERSSTLREALVSHEAWVARIHKLESENKPPPPDALW